MADGDILDNITFPMPPSTVRVVNGIPQGTSTTPTRTTSSTSSSPSRSAITNDSYTAPIRDSGNVGAGGIVSGSAYAGSGVSEINKSSNESGQGYSLAGSGSSVSSPYPSRSAIVNDSYTKPVSGSGAVTISDGPSTVTVNPVQIEVKEARSKKLNEAIKIAFPGFEGGFADYEHYMSYRWLVYDHPGMSSADIALHMRGDEELIAFAAQKGGTVPSDGTPGVNVVGGLPSVEPVSQNDSNSSVPPPDEQGSGSNPASSLAGTSPSTPVDHSDFIKRTVRHYVGREATQADVDYWNGVINRGENTLNGMQVEIIQSAEATEYRNKTLVGYNGEFDSALKQMWQDYVGREATSDELKVHGAAMKSGMTIHEMRLSLEQAPEVKTHTASDPVSADEINAQNHLMAVGEAALSASGGTDTTEYIKQVIKNYTGHTPTDADVKWWNDQITSGAETKNSMLRQMITNPGATSMQGSYSGEYDAVIDQIFRDYTGHPADADSKRIHGAALKNGMTLSELRNVMLTDPGVQSFIASNKVTPDELQKQDSLMSAIPTTGADVSAAAADIVKNMLGGQSTSPTSDTRSDDDFIKKAFKYYLGREISASELSRDKQALASGGVDRNQYLINVVHSEEGKAHRKKVLAGSRGEFDPVVKQVWNNYVGSPPDSESLDIHAAALHSGMSLDDLQNNMKTAKVVQDKLATAPVNTAQMSAMESTMSKSVQASQAAGNYELVTSPSPVMVTPGAAAPAADVVAATPAASAASGGGPTAAPQNTSPNALYINRAYRNYLGRDAQSSEIDAWNSQINSGGLTRSQFLVAVANSNEAKAFQNTQMATYGGEHDATIDQIWTGNGLTATAEDKRIHASALKGGMHSSELQGYVSDAVNQVTFTTNQ